MSNAGSARVAKSSTHRRCDRRGPQPLPQAAAKARGVKLGWSIPERASEQRQAARKGAAVNRARALAHAENVLPVIEQIRAGGASLRQIAAELNARGIKTARGGKWHATTVRNILLVQSGGEQYSQALSA